MGSSSSKQKRSPRSDHSKSPPSSRTSTGRKRPRSKKYGDTASVVSGEESRRSSVSYVPNGKVHTGNAVHEPAVDPLPNGQREHHSNRDVHGGSVPDVATNGTPVLSNGGKHVRENGVNGNHGGKKNGYVVMETSHDAMNGDVNGVHVENVPMDATDVDSINRIQPDYGADYNGGGALPKSASSQNIFSRLKNNKKANILVLWEATRDESRKKLSQLCDVAFLSSDTLAISRGEVGKAGLQLYSVEDGGRPTHVLGESFLKAPRGICAVSDGSIAVTDWEDKTVKFMDANGGFLGAWKTNKFKHPGGIAINRDGRYVIPDITRREAAIGLYSPYGKVLRRFGTDKLDWPWYVAVDRRNRIIVSERKNASVNVFDDVGRFLFSFGATDGFDTGSSRSSRNEATFNAPGGIAVDAQNNILVADTDNYRTSLFSPDGAYIKTLVTTTFSRPVSVDYDDGLIAMVTDGDLRLYKTYMEKTSF